MRQELISSNVANADTPGYKAKRLDFEAALARALDVDGQMGMKVEDGNILMLEMVALKTYNLKLYEDPNGSC
jgi:flagellar basal-body rod protein FlgB